MILHGKETVVVHRLFAFIVVGSSAVCLAAPAQDWPEFRGPTGQGIVPQGSVPTEWSPTKNVVWKQAIPGTGWSSPIVWKGRIYLTTAVPVEANEKVDQSLRALALDAKDGKILWDRELFRQDGSKTEAIHEKASHANPTPITDGQHVYVHFGPHGTAALDLDGKVVWRTADLKYRPWHGNGGSPILVDDLLIFNCDGEEVQYVVALDRANGKVVWKTGRKVEAEYKNSYCTPLLIEVQGQRQIVSPAAGAVMAYEPKTGKEIWRVRLDDGYSNVPRPVHGHGLVFLSNSTDSPHLMAIRPDGKGDVTETHVAWKQQKAVPLTSSPLLVGDELYMISDAGVATCLDAKTGQVHWRERIGGNHSASPLNADGKVYFQSEEGVGTVIKAGKKFEVIARNRIGERVLASYAVTDGALFLRTEKHLLRIESR
jgi:outer membrane protein assembly factor BamB